MVLMEGHTRAIERTNDTFPQLDVVLKLDIMLNEELIPASIPQVKFIVIRKATGEVVKTRYVSEEPFFVFHHVNAYEEDDKLVLDVIAYPRPSIINKLYLNKVRMNQYSSEDPPQLKRFVLPLISDRELQVSTGWNVAASLWPLLPLPCIVLFSTLLFWSVT